MYFEHDTKQHKIKIFMKNETIFCSAYVPENLELIGTRTVRSLVVPEVLGGLCVVLIIHSVSESADMAEKKRKREREKAY